MHFWPFRLSFPAVLCALLTGLPAPARTAEPPCALDEPYDYIQRFVPFVRWPGESEFATWRICITQDSSHAADHFSGLAARGKPFEVVHVEAPGALEGCHVLDLTAVASDAHAPWLEFARGMPLLVVGRGRAACSGGAQICLEPGSDRPFEVNLSAIHAARLKVNARLLHLGRSTLRRAP